MMQKITDEIIKAILDNDIMTVTKLMNIPEFDIDTVSTRSVNPLWAAITGKEYRNEQQTDDNISLLNLEQNKHAKFNMVKMLLQKGADPNRKSAFISSAYEAVVINRKDILRMLLYFGASVNLPNYYKIDKINSKSFVLCKMALDVAIENLNIYIVELLIKYGAIYNKFTIERAKQIKKTYGKFKKDNIEDKHNYSDIQKIVKYLESNYDESFEDTVKEYLKKNRQELRFNVHFFTLEEEPISI